MQENISIEDIKVNLLLQESADRIKEIDQQLKNSHAKPFPPAPSGSPRQDIIQQAHRKVRLDNQKFTIREDTREKIEKISGNSSASKQKEYSEKFQDWEKNPERYQSPERDNLEQNNIAREEITSKDPNFDLKYDYAKNEEMLEKMPENKAPSTPQFEPTPNYTAFKSASEPSGPLGSPEPRKDIEPNKD